MILSEFSTLKNAEMFLLASAFKPHAINALQSRHQDSMEQSATGKAGMPAE
jgi:hypothetical protein